MGIPSIILECFVGLRETQKFYKQVEVFEIYDKLTGVIETAKHDKNHLSKWRFIWSNIKLVKQSFANT